MDVCNVQFEFDTPVIPNRHDRDLAMYAGYILSPCLLSCRFFDRLPPSVARLLPLNADWQECVYALRIVEIVRGEELSWSTGFGPRTVGWVITWLAPQKNSQLATARRGAMKMGRRRRCSSVTDPFRYAPSSRLAGRPF